MATKAQTWERLPWWIRYVVIPTIVAIIGGVSWPVIDRLLGSGFAERTSPGALIPSDTELVITSDRPEYFSGNRGQVIMQEGFPSSRRARLDVGWDAATKRVDVSIDERRRLTIGDAQLELALIEVTPDTARLFIRHLPLERGRRP
jgi:hypothetical protein